jgi:copper chaperone CopZ
VRGALEPLAGVQKVDVTPGNKNVTVIYDAERVDVERMLAALEKKGEKASIAH